MLDIVIVLAITIALIALYLVAPKLAGYATK